MILLHFSTDILVEILPLLAPRGSSPPSTSTGPGFFSSDLISISHFICPIYLLHCHIINHFHQIRLHRCTVIHIYLQSSIQSDASFLTHLLPHCQPVQFMPQTAAQNMVLLQENHWSFTQEKANTRYTVVTKLQTQCLNVHREKEIQI